MPLRGSPGYFSDTSWFVRAVRAVPVIAGAALLGGLIGGFAVFAVDSALNWEPASQARPQTRADNQASAPTDATGGAQLGSQAGGQAIAIEQRATKPVRVVGGAIPDPSAGMSAPPPAAQPQRSAAAAQQQISSQPISSQPISSELLAPKPLGPATQLQPQNATAPSGTQRQNQPAIQEQPTRQTSVQTQNTTAAQQQQKGWPDALSRAHQNASNAPNPPQITPTPSAPTTGTNTNTDTSRKELQSNPTASVDYQDRPSSVRHARHNRRQPVLSTETGRYGNDDDSAPSLRRQDARSYDRLYDSSGNERPRSYGNRSEPFYGAARGTDQDDTGYRSDPRRYGHDVGPRTRSRAVTREQSTEQSFDTRQQRSEPFWGGGFFGRGYQDDY